MQLGAMNHPARDPVAEIDWIGTSGFDFIDLTLEPPGADPRTLDVDAVRRALARHRLGVVAHTAWFLPASSPFRGIRRAALEEFRAALSAAQDIGATVMNVHYGRAPSFFDTGDVVAWHVEVLEPLAAEAAASGITIVLEHVPHGGADQIDAIAAILDRVPLLRFHLDGGHAKLEGSHDRWYDYLERLGGRLGHVHLSDNDGTGDQHLPLGGSPRSTTDWQAHLKALRRTGYDGTITLEVFSQERTYLLASRDLVRRWWDAA